jgi:hypothetical protein
VRWEALFDDLEAQLEAALRSDLRAQVDERTRAERAAVAIGDRLRASAGGRLRVTLRGGTVVEGTVVDVASQWFLLGDGPLRRVLVPSGAVVAVAGLSTHAAPPAGTVERRLTLGHALRALARDRATVVVVGDGFEVAGRLERVGADHVDLTPTAGRGEPLTVAFDAMRAVRSS